MNIYLQKKIKILRMIKTPLTKQIGSLYMLSLTSCYMHYITTGVHMHTYK